MIDRMHESIDGLRHEIELQEREVKEPNLNIRGVPEVQADATGVSFIFFFFFSSRAQSTSYHQTPLPKIESLTADTTTKDQALHKSLTAVSDDRKLTVLYC